jgi:formylmethanofuran dehydrogenase subunit C
MLGQGKTMERERTCVPRLAASKRFGKYNNEKARALREAYIETDETIKRIRGAWESFGRSFPRSMKENPYDVGFDRESMAYRKAQEAVDGLNCTGEEVERFSIILGTFEGEKDFGKRAGFFLSALIEGSPGGSFTIDLSGLENHVHHLAWQNTKDILVRGTVGNALGTFMEKGNIAVLGDAGAEAGMCLRGGTIEVMGNAGDSVGCGHVFTNLTIKRDPFAWEESPAIRYHMTGGRIMVRGDARDHIGDMMNGGEIHVDGEIGSIGDIKGGKIFHKGRLIFDK